MSPLGSFKRRKAASGEQEPQPDGSIDAADRGQIAGETLPEAASPPGGGVLGGLSVNIFGDGMCYTFKK